MAAEGEHGEGDEGLGPAEPEGASVDESDLCVRGFDETVGDTPFEGAFDRGSVSSDAVGELDEGRDAGAGCPGEPVVELHLGLEVGKLEYLAEDFLELPGAVQASVRGGEDVETFTLLGSEVFPVAPEEPAQWWRPVFGVITGWGAGSGGQVTRLL